MIQVFWNVMLCQFLTIFRGMVMPSGFGSVIPVTILLGLLYSEDEGTTIVRNVGNYIPVDRP
jgi:hypothetical protein